MWARSFRSYKSVGPGLLLCLLTLAFGQHQGRDLFYGTEPLTGKIREHKDALPAEVVVCASCHASVQGKKIDRDYLLEPRRRRGGPPSSYDEGKFCRLLRTGVDPAYILIARAMPVYTVTDAECGSLWRLLTSDGKP